MKDFQVNSSKENDLKILEQALSLEIEAIKRYHEQHDIVKTRRSIRCWKDCIEMRSITRKLFGSIFYG